MSRIQSFRIQNFKGVKKIEAQPLGRDVIIIGGNGEGKTSVLDALWALMTNDLPPEPIAKGAKEAIVEADLEGYSAKLRLFKKTARSKKIERELTVTHTKTGKVIDTPRDLIDSLAGKSVAFSVDKFLRLSDAKRIEYLAEAIGLGADYRTAMLDYEEAYDNRRLMKKELTHLNENFEPYDPKDLELQVDSITELVQRLAAAEKSQQYFDSATRQRDQITMEIAKDEALLNEVIERLDNNRARLGKAEEWLQSPQNQPVPKEQIEAMRASVNDIEAVKTRHEAAVKGQTLEAEIAQLENDIADINSEMNETRARVTNMLSEQLGVPELGIDIATKKMVLGDLPFEIDQINTAERTRIGLKIASKILTEGGMQVVRFDGSLIDWDNRKLIEEWADEAGIQLFVELVDRDGGSLEIQISESE